MSERHKNGNYWDVQETTVAVEGLEREVLLVHVTDLHLTEVDERNPEALEYMPKIREIFDNQAPEEGFSREKHLRNIVEACNEMGADALLLTGDIVHYPSEACLDIMEKCLSGLRMPYLFTLGNHDWHFPHLEWNDETRAAYYGHFSRFADPDPSFQRLDIAGVRLLAVDNSNYQIDEKQWEMFQDSQKDRLPTLLFMHIPLHLDDLAEKTTAYWTAPILMGKGWFGGTQPTDLTRRFYGELTANPLGNLKAVFTGHVHFPHEEALPGGGMHYVTKAGFAGHVRVIRLVP